MTDDLDLGLDLGELEPIFNRKWQNVPIVYFAATGKFGSFNRVAERMLTSPMYSISFNSEYIVLTPVNVGGYRITPHRHGNAHMCTNNLTHRLPQLKGKRFKLYKSGERLAIKRYEPLEDV